MDNTRQFGFRAGLNDSVFDTSITLTSASGDPIFKREFTIKTFLIMLASIMTLLVIEFQTPIGHGGIGAVIFGIAWLLGGWQLAQPTEANTLAAQYIPVLAKYLSKAARNLSFRTFAPSFAVSQATDIQDNGVSDNGLIRFFNNDVGRVFEITGSASRLMFDADKSRVVHDARMFYRNINPATTLIIDTLSSPQRVKTQLLAKDWQLEHMRLNDSNLRQLVYHERQALSEHVGGSFPMYHQYFVVRSVNEDELNIFIQWLMQVMSNNSFYLKDIRPLDDQEETLDYLHGLFAADSDILNEEE